MRIGISPQEYNDALAQGQAWCWSCRQWLARERFPRDRCRPSGRSGRCGECRAAADDLRPR